VENENPVVRETKSVDQLFEEVRGYDLVLTAEASLADALNSRKEEEERFAITPRRIVTEEKGGDDFRREAFLELAEERDMSWRQAAYLLRNILDCWQETGDLEKIKEYERFGEEEIEQVIDVLKSIENPFSLMEKGRISGKKEVAVVGLYQFNELEKKLLPEKFDAIEVFTEEEHDLSEFKIFESKRDIVQSLKENVQRVGPENAGVVMHPESSYSSLVESVFEAEEIPYLAQRDISENNDLRTAVNLVRIGLSRENVRVKDVRPIIEELEFSVPRGKDNMLVSDAEGLEEFKEFFNILEYLDFGEVVEEYAELTGRKMGRVREVLEELNMVERSVDLESLRNLEYFIDSFELPESETTEGVLLADPKEVSNVDRPVVFFLGMSSDWTRETGNRPWIDRETEEEKNLKDFTSLIQSGREQVYMVQDREMNQDITPCFHLNQILDFEFSTFRDLPHTRYRPENKVEEKGFGKKEVDVEVEEIETLSQSRLNSFVLSPKLYYFEQLVSDAEDEKLEKGNVFHDYAEFYINHSNFVEELGEEEVLNFMVEQVEPYVEDSEVEKLRTELRLGLKNIQEFLREHEVEEKNYEGLEKEDGENIFAEEYDKPVDSGVTEMSFRDKDLGAKGKVDLVLNETHLVDYKSGRKYDAKDIVEASNVELCEDADWPDFQAIMYLTYRRKFVPDEKLKFTFLNFLHNMEDVIDGEDSLEDNTVTVTYYPETFDEKVSSLEMYEHLLKNSGKTSYQGKMLRKLGCPEFREFFQGREIEDPYDKEKLLDSELAEEFKEYAKEEVGDYKYVRKGCEQVLKSLVDFRRSNYFREDLDRFEEFLDEKIEELNNYRKNGFPLKAEADDLPKRDMIVE